jgi:putative membrane protein
VVDVPIPIPIPNWAKGYLRPERVQLVEDAIRAAEDRTSGEIVPMIVRRSSTIGHVAVILACLLVAGFFIVDGPGWQYAWIGEHWSWYLVDTVLLLLLSGQLAKLPLLQRWLTTSDDQTLQVDMRAQIEFYQSNIHTTANATGVLLLVSLMEHRAVVLADEAIDARVPRETWDEVIRLIIDGIKKGHVGLGLAAAIERCGDILAAEFPVGDDDVNELKDTLIVKE